MLFRSSNYDEGSVWISMDFLDVVVHVLTPEAREYYRLEQLWGEAPRHRVEVGEAAAS